MKRSYKLTVVMRPDFDEKDDKKAEAAIKKLVGEQASVTEVTAMGKKTLAYPIKKHNEGVYYGATIQANGLIVANLERQMKLGTDVIRYLLTSK